MPMKTSHPTAPARTRTPSEDAPQEAKEINGAAAPAEERDPALIGSESQLVLDAMLAFRSGDFSVRLPAGWDGMNGKVADAFNDVLAMAQRRSEETVRVCRLVGREGKLKQRMRVPGLIGGWADEVDSLNGLMDDLVWPTTEVTR